MVFVVTNSLTCLFFLIEFVFNILVCATKKKPVINSIGQKDLSAEFEDNGVMSQLLLEVCFVSYKTVGHLYYSIKNLLSNTYSQILH